jgi:hypothetical protein
MCPQVGKEGCIVVNREGNASPAKQLDVETVPFGELRMLTPLAWRGYCIDPPMLVVRVPDGGQFLVDPPASLASGLLDVATSTPKMQEWSRRFAEAVRDGRPLPGCPFDPDEAPIGDPTVWGRREGATSWR